MRQYVIVKKNNKYQLLDIFFEEMKDLNIRFRKTKDNKLYTKVIYEVLDDWYADIGEITYEEHEVNYIGKIVFQSDDIEEAALVYAQLIKRC